MDCLPESSPVATYAGRVDYANGPTGIDFRIMAQVKMAMNLILHNQRSIGHVCKLVIDSIDENMAKLSVV
jgi:hypothetical protein